MTDSPDPTRTAQFTYVSSYVRRLDPSATDAAIVRYLAEIETMANALQSLEVPVAALLEPFSPQWRDGVSA